MNNPERQANSHKENVLGCVDDRRRSKRFRLRGESAFVLTKSWPSLGELVDISEGGFAFNYAAAKEWPRSIDEGCMLFGANDSCLNDVPMRIVSDQLIAKEEGAKIHPDMRRRCIQFGELNGEQRFLLECFIWINGVPET